MTVGIVSFFQPFFLAGIQAGFVAVFAIVQHRPPADVLLVVPVDDDRLVRGINAVIRLVFVDGYLCAVQMSLQLRIRLLQLLLVLKRDKENIAAILNVVDPRLPDQVQDIDLLDVNVPQPVQLVAVPENAVGPRPFLHLLPMVTVVTNIEPDHLDTYGGDFNVLKKTFVEFLHNLPFYGVAIVCIDDPNIKDILPEIGRTVITYGTSEEADFRVTDFKEVGPKSEFTILRKNDVPLKIELPVPGIHMAKNAAAAVAVAIEEGIADNVIVDTLKNFKGVGRRFQNYGDFVNNSGNSLTLVDDYGHHPTEVEATINAARLAYPDKKLVMVFQPHRYTRTRDCYEDFVRVLQLVDTLILVDVYPAGEEPIAGADGRHLCASIRAGGRIEPHFAQTVNEVPQLLEDLVTDGALLITQGAGNVVQVAKNLSELYKKK